MARACPEFFKTEELKAESGGWVLGEGSNPLRTS